MKVNDNNLGLSGMLQVSSGVAAKNSSVDEETNEFTKTLANEVGAQKILTREQNPFEKVKTTEISREEAEKNNQPTKLKKAVKAFKRDIEGISAAILNDMMGQEDNAALEAQVEYQKEAMQTISKREWLNSL